MARVRLAFLISAHRCRSSAHRLEPAPQVLKIVQVLLLTLPRHDPWIGRHVGNRVIVPGEINAASEPSIQDTVEPVGLLDVPVDRVGYSFGRVLPEVMVLAGHRPRDRRPSRTTTPRQFSGRERPSRRGKAGSHPTRI